MEIYRTNQVFVPGGMPRHTYVARDDRELEDKLLATQDNLCKLVTITAPTKFGKTVLVNRLFPRFSDRSVWLDGGSIKSEDDAWRGLLTELHGFTSVESTESIELAANLGGKAEGNVGVPLIASGKIEVNASGSRKTASSEKRALNVASRPAAIAQLRVARRPLIIDDFHYIPREVQGELVRAIKPLIFDGHVVILLAIPHRRYDAVRVEREMTGRVETIEIPPWNEKELTQIARAGFPLLNLTILGDALERLAEEANGSPHLMQEFCRQVCAREVVQETLRVPRAITLSPQSLFHETADGSGRVAFDRLAKGPTQRADRKLRRLKSGQTADIYQAVLLALSAVVSRSERLEYEEIRSGLRKVLASELPQAHEVSRVLEHMSKIGSADSTSTSVIDWDKAEQRLYLTDPFFSFFLKWRTAI